MLYTMTSTIVEMFVVRDGGIALVEKVVGLGSAVRGFRLGAFPNCWQGVNRFSFSHVGWGNFTLHFLVLIGKRAGLAGAVLHLASLYKL